MRVNEKNFPTILISSLAQTAFNIFSSRLSERKRRKCVIKGHHQSKNKSFLLFILNMYFVLVVDQRMEYQLKPAIAHDGYTYEGKNACVVYVEIFCR